MQMFGRFVMSLLQRQIGFSPVSPPKASSQNAAKAGTGHIERINFIRRDMNMGGQTEKNKEVKIAPLAVTVTTKNQDSHKTDIWKIIPITISILSLIISAINVYMTFSLTSASERREVQNQTLSYSLVSEYKGMKYTYTYNGEKKETRAPTMILKVTSGAICTVTPIRFNENGIYVAETVTPYAEGSLLDKEYFLTIDSDSPGEVDIEGEIAYDYFFLYIQPLSGEPILDLVCHRINVLTEKVETRVYHRIDLIGIDPQDSHYFTKILNRYKQLYDLINELPA